MGDPVRVSTPVTQSRHGFPRGSVVRFDGTGWVQGNAGDAGLGVVGSIISTDAFEFVQLGFVENLPTLIPGTLYYASGSGGISTTPSASPVLYAYTVSSAFVVSIAGSTTTSSGGGSDSTAALVALRKYVDATFLTKVDGANTLKNIDGGAVIDIINGSLVFDEQGNQVLDR